MGSDIIKISHLTKSFGDVKAVNDLNFKVKRGELFAFLGVNGAGKSTTISIICGQLYKDSGSVEIDGVAAEKLGNELGKKLGIVFQDSVLDKPLTVRENLKSRAALYGITGMEFDVRLGELTELLGFEDYINRPVGHAVEPKLPFRGPEFFRDGDRTYICKVCGGFEWFSGSEAIFHGENKVYECVFHGGFVR